MPTLPSDQQKRVKLYEDWLKLREIAKQKNGGTLPDGFNDTVPKPPPPIEDIDIDNLTMDLSAASLDAELGQDLDDSGIERVPMADPGLEVSIITMLSVGLFDIPILQNSYGEAMNEFNPASQSPHVRRKSVLPGMLRIDRKLGSMS